MKILLLAIVAIVASATNGARPCTDLALELAADVELELVGDLVDCLEWKFWKSDYDKVCC